MLGMMILLEVKFYRGKLVQFDLWLKLKIEKGENEFITCT